MKAWSKFRRVVCEENMKKGIGIVCLGLDFSPGILVCASKRLALLAELALNIGCLENWKIYFNPKRMGGTMMNPQ